MGAGEDGANGLAAPQPVGMEHKAHRGLATLRTLSMEENIAIMITRSPLAQDPVTAMLPAPVCGS